MYAENSKDPAVTSISVGLSFRFVATISHRLRWTVLWIYVVDMDRCLH